MLIARPLFGCGINVDAREHLYRQQQARDLVGEYEQARSRGDILGMCVKSNQVSAAYVDARDQGDATEWRARNREDCQSAREVLAPASEP